MCGETFKHKKKFTPRAEFLAICDSGFRGCINNTSYINRCEMIADIITNSISAYLKILTHWGRVTHICVSKLTIIGSDNGLSPGRCEAIIRTNAGILWIGPLGANFSEILIEIYTFSFRKMHLKMSGKWRPFCLGLNVLMFIGYFHVYVSSQQPLP